MKQASNSTIGERIRFIRKENGLTQEEFGKRISISTGMVSLYESDKPNRIDRTLNDIGKEFNVRKEWLLNGTGEIYNTDNDDSITTELKNELEKTQSLYETAKISASHMEKVDWEEINKFIKEMAE